MPREILVDWERLPRRRINKLTGRSTLIAAQRKLRKRKEAEVTAYPSNLPEFLADCPFCPGNEELTPKELVRISDSTNPGKWRTRGFANLFPFLMIEEKKLSNGSEYDLFEEHSAVGANEIIVESSKHNACLSRLSEDEIAAIFSAMIDRYFDLKRDPRFRYFYAFQNYGPGASQEHPHWQLETSETAPHLIYEIHKNMGEYKLKSGKCLLCELWQGEKGKGRTVLETEHFIAYIPFAPSEPYEVMLVPKEHFPCFASCLQDQELSLEFALVIKQIMIKVKKVLQGEDWKNLADPPYLFCLYTAPYDEDKGDGYYHWFLDFLPRTTHKVGHERGTEEDIITVFPEEAAEILRKVDG